MSERDIEDLRKSLIKALEKLDSNGIWSDEDSIREGMQPLSYEKALEAYNRLTTE